MRCSSSMPLKERIMRRVVIDAGTGCWNWTGADNGRGYGYMGFGGKSQLVHRLMFELSRGCKIPDDMETDHLCRNRRCANPAHLQCVTPSVNNRRGARGWVHRTHCKRGHEMMPSNMKRDSRGNISCRACVNMLWNQRAHRIKLAPPPAAREGAG